MERSEQELVRIEKLDKIREYCNPYPDKYVRTHTLKEARLLPDGTSDVRIAGRIVFMRKMGKLSFIRIRVLMTEHYFLYPLMQFFIIILVSWYIVALLKKNSWAKYVLG